jgi:hypothetical protein
MAADKSICMEQVVPRATGTNIEMVLKTVCLCVSLAPVVQTCQAANLTCFTDSALHYFLHAKHHMVFSSP